MNLSTFPLEMFMVDFWIPGKILLAWADILVQGLRHLAYKWSHEPLSTRSDYWAHSHKEVLSTARCNQKKQNTNKAKSPLASAVLKENVDRLRDINPYNLLGKNLWFAGKLPRGRVYPLINSYWRWERLDPNTFRCLFSHSIMLFREDISSHCQSLRLIFVCLFVL